MLVLTEIRVPLPNMYVFYIIRTTEKLLSGRTRSMQFIISSSKADPFMCIIGFACSHWELTMSVSVYVNHSVMVKEVPGVKTASFFFFFFYIY